MRTQIDSSGVLTTQTTYLATVPFRPGPGPKAMVLNRCYHLPETVMSCMAGDGDVLYGRGWR
jgi:hypothetical protein